MTGLVISGAGLSLLQTSEIPFDRFTIYTGSLSASLGSSSVISLSGTTISSTAATGTLIGTATVSGATGTPTWSFSSNPGSLYAIDSGDGAVTNAVSPLTPGSDPITISVSGMTPSPPDRDFTITVTGEAGFAPSLNFSDSRNSQYAPLFGGLL